jgi:VIT1/CCC1 family predicted Fe2+/Mn2+ transporter
MVGLYSGTASKSAVLGGIITIAIADAMSDALGMHISEESVNKNHSYVWAATISTFITKFIFALTFVIPVWFLDLKAAVIVSILWGLFSLIFINYFIAKKRKEKPLSLISEHVIIAILVVIVTYFTGEWISKTFN